eukprot:scaffold1913_cov257-Pinguiococcus_pyrenoidosus.AAC.13
MMLKLMVSALLVAQAAAFGLKSSLASVCRSPRHASSFTAAKTRSGSSLQMKLGENLRNAAASAVIAAAALNLGPGIASAETEVRQGMYKEYTIEKKSQQVIDLRRGVDHPRHEPDLDFATFPSALSSMTTPPAASSPRRRRLLARTDMSLCLACLSSARSSSPWHSTGGTSRTTSRCSRQGSARATVVVSGMMSGASKRAVRLCTAVALNSAQFSDRATQYWGCNTQHQRFVFRSSSFTQPKLTASSMLCAFSRAVQTFLQRGKTKQGTEGSNMDEGGGSFSRLPDASKWPS